MSDVLSDSMERVHTALCTLLPFSLWKSKSSSASKSATLSHETWIYPKKITIHYSSSHANKENKTFVVISCSGKECKLNAKVNCILSKDTSMGTRC